MFAVLLKETFTGKFFMKLTESKFQFTYSDRNDFAAVKLVVAAFFIKRNIAVYQNFLTVFWLKYRCKSTTRIQSDVCFYCEFN